ncbi:DUF1571 domain-containing protein [Planctomicrobium sp. SH661]|uniref:DUF1571 domain-containing protein n=1 Tax=Planctomicrobium sp. SH661 TaxID=3448124 RepID=UPI003F5AE1AE
MSRPAKLNRRVFLTNSAAACSALGTGLLVGGKLFADRTQLAARVSETEESHPLRPAFDLATKSMTAMDAVNDYQATFIKTELVGRNTLNTRMELKLREEPFSVYLKFIQPHAGREVIYAKGQNKDNLQVHDVGFASLAGTLSLDPKGSIAMEENRYPVSSIGMRNMLIKLVDTWLAEQHLQEMHVNVFPKSQIGDLACQAVEVSHPKHHPQAKFQMTRLYLDREHHWPVRVQAFAFPGKKDKEPVLVEDYMYADLKVNVALGNIDFSTKNPKYRF